MWKMMTKLTNFCHWFCKIKINQWPQTKCRAQQKNILTALHGMIVSKFWTLMAITLLTNCGASCHKNVIFWHQWRIPVTIVCSISSTAVRNLNKAVPREVKATKYRHSCSQMRTQLNLQDWRRNVEAQTSWQFHRSQNSHQWIRVTS